MRTSAVCRAGLEVPAISEITTPAVTMTLITSIAVLQRDSLKASQKVSIVFGIIYALLKSCINDKVPIPSAVSERTSRLVMLVVELSHSAEAISTLSSVLIA